MSERKPTRLNLILREFNISLDRAVDYLKEKGIEIESNPNTKITGEIYGVLFNEFASDADRKKASIEVGEEKRKEKEAIKLEIEKEEQKRKLEEEAKKAEVIRAKAVISGPKQIGMIDLSPKKTAKKEEPKLEEQTKTETPKSEEQPKKEVEIPTEQPIKEQKTEVVAEAKTEVETPTEQPKEKTPKKNKKKVSKKKQKNSRLLKKK